MKNSRFTNSVAAKYAAIIIATRAHIAGGTASNEKRMLPMEENTSAIDKAATNTELAMNNLLGLLLKNVRVVRSENAIIISVRIDSMNHAVRNCAAGEEKMNNSAPIMIRSNTTLSIPK